MDKTLISGDFNEDDLSMLDDRTKLLNCIDTLHRLVGNLTNFSTGNSADLLDKLTALNETACECRVKIEMERWEHINHPSHKYTVMLKRRAGDNEDFNIDQTVHEWTVDGTLYNLGCLMIEVLREHVSYSIYSNIRASDVAIMTMNQAYSSLGEATQRYVRTELPGHYLLIDITPSIDMCGESDGKKLSKWFKQLGNDAPENRKFEILVRPGEEEEKIYHFTGTLLKFKQELINIISSTHCNPPHDDLKQVHLNRYVVGTLSALNKFKLPTEDTIITAKTPFNHVIKMSGIIPPTES